MDASKNTAPNPRNFKPIFIAFLIIFLLILAGIAGYFTLSARKKEKPIITLPKEEPEQVSTPSSTFAAYKEIPVNINPKVPAYTVAANLTNVTNIKDFELSEAAKNLLVKNGFVVKPAWNREFYPLYESNRYSFIPNFVTTDSILHNYHLMFNYLLEKLETEKLAGELKNLNTMMLTSTLAQYESLKASSFENAGRRNVGFFAVGSKLLDPNLTVPETVKKEVGEELTLIEAHQGIEQSPVMGIGAPQQTKIDSPAGPLPLEALKEDYSQYIPRGHYDKSDLLKAYFKSMMWYGRLTFRFKSEDEIKSALLITLTLNNENNQKSWDKIYTPINFFVGKSDDITYYQLKDLLIQVYGQNPSLQSIVNDQTKFAAFVEQTKKLAPPQINSMPVFQASIQSDREKEIKGFRFFGQRFTIDAAIFQRLITREVGPKDVSCNQAPFDNGRMLPKGLDIPSAMGSKEAYNILKDQGELAYACYPENMAKLNEYIAGLKTDTWTQNLYWGWLYSLLPLTGEKPEGYPSFMRNLAWMRKELNTYLGSWTELKHDTILYAKQVYAEMGGGREITEKDDRGYVEPNPYVYSRLASLLALTKEGLATRGLLSDTGKDNLEKMEKLATSLLTISQKELSSTGLTKDEYDLIRTYGGQLEHFWLEVNKEEMKGIDRRNFLDQNPAAIVADVATDPNGQVLEEGTGNIFEIYAVVPVEGKLKLAKGGVYSYYEFPHPMSDRLTDQKWREMLDNDKAPSLPSWTDAFIASEK